MLLSPVIPLYLDDSSLYSPIKWSVTMIIGLNIIVQQSKFLKHYALHGGNDMQLSSNSTISCLLYSPIK